MRERERDCVLCVLVCARLLMRRELFNGFAHINYVILGHFSKKRDQKESHPPSFLFFVSFCSLEFLSFFLDFAFCLEALSFPDLFIFYRRHIYLSLFFFFFRERERERKKDRRERERQSTKIRERVERQPLSRRFEEKRVGFL